MNRGDGGLMSRFGLAIGVIALAGGSGPAVAQDTPQPPVAADIVFIYDNSGSMWSHYAKIDSIGSDTTFYPSACFGTAVPQTTPFTYSTASGPRTIELLPDSAVCRSYAGDPYQVRTSIISQAIDYLAVRSPNSTAGAMAFAANVGHVRPPLPLSMPGNADLVKASLAMDSISATNYVPPLQLATTWLNDSSLAPAARKAIVFISDGEPNDGSAFIPWINTHPDIPIYAIALGDSGPDFSRMRMMSDFTGGSFSLVDPRDVSRMGKKVQELIDAITATITTSIAKGRAGSPRTLRAGGPGRLAEPPWLVRARGHAYDLRGRLGPPTK